MTILEGLALNNVLYEGSFGVWITPSNAGQGMAKTEKKERKKNSQEKGHQYDPYDQYIRRPRLSSLPPNGMYLE